MTDTRPIPSVELPYAYGLPEVQGTVRRAPEDFQVDEDLGFEPAGEGEHVFLLIRKRNENTDWVAGRLGRLAGVKPADVGYAGLKDRQAVTTQWFSVNLAGRPEPDWSVLEGDNIGILAVRRHSRKLRKGALRGNRFVLVIRDLQGDRASLEERLRRIAQEGVPNYFGAQRFGIGGGNLARAQGLFSGSLQERNRHKRGLYLSAARSMLFNEVLAQRVRAGTWAQPLAGDAMVLEGTHSFFVIEEVDAETRRRCAAMDIHPSGPLWGAGELHTRGEARRLEESVLAPLEFWRDGLERFGLTQERRPLRLKVEELAWEFPNERELRVSFRLPAGAYATTVLREMIHIGGE